MYLKTNTERIFAMSHIDYTKYVNTNIGTIGHLLQATAPCVQSPHCCAVVRPAFRPGMKDVYISDKIFGFNAGAATIMPTVSSGKPEYYATASSFDHDFESAHPDYYEVLLEDHNIHSRHTANKNYGLFEFTFPAGQAANVVIYTRKNFNYTYENGRIYLLTDGKGLGRGSTEVMLDVSGNTGIDIYDTTLPNGWRIHLKEEATAIVVKFDNERVSLPFVLSTAGKETLDE